MSALERIAVTGVGVVTPLGHGPVALGAALQRGDHAIRPVPFFEGTPLEGRLGGVVADAGERWPRGAVTLSLAVRSIQEAIAASGSRGGRTALVVGTTMAPRERPLELLAAQIRDAVDLPDALVITVSTACTSSTAVFAVAMDLLRAGDVDRVIAGGSDEIDTRSFGGFSALGLVCDAPCTPFGPRLGTSLGEGAAFFVVERVVDALARGATLHAVVEGVATTSDGHHPTSPHPAGDGLARAALAALADAGAAPDGIDWVSAHGTGTRANDAAEQQAVERIFGERAPRVPITAGKSLVGHALGAAGAVETAMILFGLERGIVPATAGAATRRPGCDLDVVTSPRPTDAGRVLKLAAAFGGANAALVLAAPRSSAPAPALRPRRVVRVVGLGGLGPGDPARDPMEEGVMARGRVAPLDLDAVAPGTDPRGLDPIAQHLAVAVARALAPLGGAPWGAVAARTGLFVGQRRASPASYAAFEEAIATRGVDRVPGSAFTRKVFNAATGAITRAFALRGPTTTVSTGAASGLTAVVLAAEHLAARDDADRVVAAATEELSPAEDERVLGDGAAAVVLGADGPPAGGIGVVLAGWAIGGPGDRAAVSARAARSVGGREEMEELVVDDRLGDGASLDGMLALGRAVAAVRSGSCRCLRVVESGPLVTVALVVRAEGVDHAS